MRQIGIGGIGNYAGFPIIESKWLTKKVQAKIHSKKRINKKWKKRYGFVEIPDNKVYVMGNSIVGSPATVALIKNSIGRMD